MSESVRFKYDGVLTAGAGLTWPGPLSSGTASLSGVAGLSESVRFKYDGVITAGAGLLWLAGNAAKLGFGDTVGLEKGADLLEGLRAGS